MTKKLLTWGGIAFMIFFIAVTPAQGTETLKRLADIAGEFHDFFTNLVGG